MIYMFLLRYKHFDILLILENYLDFSPLAILGFHKGLKV